MSNQSTVEITGNTYPVKDSLKALGARWNADRKAWMVPAGKAERARAIVAGAGPVVRRAYTGPRRDRYEDECELCGRNKYTCGHCIGW